MFWIVFGITVIGLSFAKILASIQSNYLVQTNESPTISPATTPRPKFSYSIEQNYTKPNVNINIEYSPAPQLDSTSAELSIPSLQGNTEQYVFDDSIILEQISTKSIFTKKREALRHDLIQPKNQLKIKEQPPIEKKNTRRIGLIEESEEEEYNIFEDVAVDEDIILGVKTSKEKTKTEPIITMEEIIDYDIRQHEEQHYQQQALLKFYSNIIPTAKRDEQQVIDKISKEQQQIVQHYETRLKELDKKGLDGITKIENEIQESKKQQELITRSHESKYNRAAEVIRLENERKREEEAKRIAEEAKKAEEIRKREAAAAEQKRIEEEAKKAEEAKKKEAAAAAVVPKATSTTTSSSTETIIIPEHVSPEAYLLAQKRLKLVEIIGTQVKAKTKEIMTASVQYFSSEVDPQTGRTLRPKQENQGLKQALGYLRKQINACSTENIQMMKRHILMEVITPIITSKPDLKQYLFYLLAELMYQQSQQITADEAKPLILAEIILDISLKYLDFIDVQLGFFSQKCIYLIPRLIKQQSGQSTLEYHKQLKYIDDGTEPDDGFTNRMKNIIAIYAGIFALAPKMTPNFHPFHISNAWTYLARILNLDPSFDPNIACILQVFLINVSHRLKAEYGKQFLKMLLFLKESYYERIIKVKGRSTNTFLINLSGTLDKILKNQTVAPEYIISRRIM